MEVKKLIPYQKWKVEEIIRELSKFFPVVSIPTYAKKYGESYIIDIAMKFSQKISLLDIPTTTWTKKLEKFIDNNIPKNVKFFNENCLIYEKSLIFFYASSKITVSEYIESMINCIKYDYDRIFIVSLFHFDILPFERIISDKIYFPDLKRYNFKNLIGRHEPVIIKEKSILDIEKLEEMYDYPIQIFITENYKVFSSPILSTNTNIYVHSPYQINLASDKPIDYHCLVQIFLTARKFNGRGVVVHTGTTSSEKGANEIMKNTIFKCLPSATEECPFLLETPAAEKNSTLWSIEDMINFFIYVEDPKMKLCVDTCHVFSSGYNPMNYIEIFSEALGVDKIGLIHFNGSMTKRGSRVDRHTGWKSCMNRIPEEIMNQIREFSEINGIDLIME